MLGNYNIKVPCLRFEKECQTALQEQSEWETCFSFVTASCLQVVPCQELTEEVEQEMHDGMMSDNTPELQQVNS